MLHFEVQKKRGDRSDYLPSVASPKRYPCYILVFNDDWNDYSYHTWFCLYRFQSKTDKKRIGEFKLMRRGCENTYDELDEQFDTPLGDDYCSLGIAPDYYSKLRDVVTDKREREELLTYLRDCTWNSRIYESFMDDEIFNISLLREMESGKALKDGRFILLNRNPDEAYSFQYVFSPQKKVDVTWNVSLSYKSEPFMRCLGLIGENGVGKTRMLSGMVKELVSHNGSSLACTLFNSCLVLCSTPLDKYPIPADKDRIPYEVYSLEQDTDETETKLVSALELILERPRLNGQELFSVFRQILEKYIGDITDGVYESYREDDKIKWRVNKAKVQESVRILSSGELHTLLLLSHIYANVHFSSLLVIDEPEVHLHPSIIKDFMIILCEILSDFDSFAIIATHSPLVVREMANTNVFLMQKVENDILQIGKVPFDTFGEDTARLYKNIFGYDEADSYFMEVVRRLREEESLDYKEIVDYLEKYMKLSFNAKLLIRDLCSE